MITVAADGSALGNPGPAGWAWYINDNQWKAGGWPHGTNNQGELMAILDFLRATDGSGEDIHFLCDSKYAIDSVTKWRHGWKQKGWRTASGDPVKNLEIMQELDAVLDKAKREGRSITFEWVRGHSGHKMNEAADLRARAVAETYNKGKAPGAGITGPGLNGTGLNDTGLSESTLTANEPGQKIMSTKQETLWQSDNFPKTQITAIHTTQLERTADKRDTVTRKYQQGAYTIYEHRITVPLWHGTQGSEKGSEIEVFAREIVSEQAWNMPYAIYFQGGPGCEGTRSEDWSSGWLGEITKRYRFIMLDQRGTGQSTPLDVLTIPALGSAALEHLTAMRADQIVGDAETLREALGVGEWTVFGQSFGGFIITAYLSRYPESITRAFITGGLPGLTDVDTIYGKTYAAIEKRNKELYQDKHLESVIRDVAKHILSTEECLPTGEVLTTPRLRSVGMCLGRTAGIAQLRNLFEGPFVTVAGKRRLSTAFLANLNANISQAGRPLYVLLHETIYANAVAGAGATNWSADRLREILPGFGLETDPADINEPYYLTGESFGRWTYASEPALDGLLGLAEQLAVKVDWPTLYSADALANAHRPVFAAVYPDDVFVPYQLSLATANIMGAEVHEFPEYHHDGLRASGTQVIATLLQAAERSEAKLS